MADFPIPLYPERVDEDEIETEALPSADLSEYTIRIRSANGQPLSTADVILELEYQISEMSRADDRIQLGVTTH